MSTIGALSAYQQYEQVSPILESEKASKIQKIGEADLNSKFSAPSNQEIEDKAIISDQAKALYEAEQSDNSMQKKSEEKQVELNLLTKGVEKEETQEQTTQEERKSEKNNLHSAQEELSQAEKQMVSKLEQTDAKVKAHEQAHMAAAGGLNVSGASYDYEVGPDGKKYAVAGEVSIGFRESSEPEQNLQNAKKMKTAALAPADPSSTDRAVASHADSIIADAQKEIVQERTEEMKSEETPENPTETPANDNLKEIAPETTSQKQADAPMTTPLNTAESIINPSAQAIIAGSVAR